MSLGSHLTALECRSMTSLYPKQPYHQLSSNVGHSKEIFSRRNHNNGLVGMKEYSLINHIESLKAVANGTIPVISATPTITAAAGLSSPPLACQNNFPQIVSFSHLTDHIEPTHFQTRPLSSKWATDPDSVPGNLRKNSDGKPLSLTLEEILSRGSSVVAKRNDNENEEEDHYDDNGATKRITSKGRKKSGKSSKKKHHKSKDSSKSLLVSVGKEGKHLLPSTVKENDKSEISPYSQLEDIASITALCKSIKIQEKPSNSINVKQIPYTRKNVMNNSNQKSNSILRASLDKAAAEYTKMSQTVHTHSDHRRKASNADDDASKTKKIFLSEKQSGVISDCGANIPCAPPATPTADHLRRYEYVPSLQDIRSQRSFRQRLQMMESRAAKKEKKKQAENMKMHKMSMREKRIEMKKKQRLEIYALNKLMTDLENERFRQFMLNNGSNV